MAPLPVWVRSIAALVTLLVWLGLVVYDALTPSYEMPPALWALGPALLAYMLGLEWRRGSLVGPPPDTDEPPLPAPLRQARPARRLPRPPATETDAD